MKNKLKVLLIYIIFLKILSKEKIKTIMGNSILLRILYII